MDVSTKQTTFLIDEFISTFGKSWSVRPPALLDYNLDLLNGNNNKEPSPNSDQIRKNHHPTKQTKIYISRVKAPINGQK